MLDWMKGKIGRKGSTLQRLVAGDWKDDAEKQALIQEVATDTSIDGEALLPLLSCKDSVVQQRAQALFAARADADAVTALFVSAAASEGAVRAALLTALGRARPNLVEPAIDLALKDSVPERLRAAWALALALPPAMSDRLLEQALSDAPPASRFAALDRLLKGREVESLRPLLIKAATERDARLRTLAVEALAKLEGDDVFESMLERLSNDDDKAIRNKAGGWLQKSIAGAPVDMRPTILGRLLLAGDADIQGSLLRALFSGGGVSELLLEILTFCKTILGIQHQTVMGALKSVGEVVLTATLPLLVHEDADIRVQALLLVEKFQDPKVVGTVVKLLEDADWWVRIMATEVLGRLKDPRVVPYLDRVLADPDAKWAAIDALGNVGDDASRTSLTRLLDDAQVEVRIAAVDGLAKIQSPEVDKVLEGTAQNDASLDVRIRAIELGRERRGSAATGGGSAMTSDKITIPIDKLLTLARESSASDVHVSPGEPPLFRIHGKLARLAKTKPLSAQNVSALLSEILDSVRKPILERTGSVDFCYSIAGVGRYRVNVFRQQRGLSAAFRCIPNVPPTIADLGLPKALETVSTYHQGIVLVTGPAGSGKSTTLTALVNSINEMRQAHVLMLEDPIEFLHPPKKSLINQREIGRDSKSFAAAMRAALREDPDVVVVGEMRDRETIRLALLAAETGHLVVATMQTTSAVATIDKLVESFPTDEQQQVRVALSTSLKLVVSQNLAPRKDESGRVAIFEVLKTTSGIRAMIREGKTFQLPSAMQIGRSQGMRTVDTALEELLAAGVISNDTAIQYAEKKETFDPRARAKGIAAPAPAAPTPATTVAVAPGAASAGRAPATAGPPAPAAAPGVAVATASGIAAASPPAPRVNPPRPGDS